MKNKQEKCIMCEKTEIELGGLTFLRFTGTGYLLCCICYEKLGSPEYFNTNKSMDFNIKHKQKIPHKIRIKVYERDAYRCVYCGSFKDLTVDHEHPESKGGETSIDNLVTCCRDCNCKKGAKSRGDFIGKSTT